MNRLPKTRHSLLLRLADAGDTDAWREFAEVYERAIFRFVCSRGLQVADADDVTQRVLEAVLAKSRTWDPSSGGSFSAWLFRVARNLAAKAWNEQSINVTNLSSDSSANWWADVSSPTEEEKTAFQMEYRKALFHWAADRVKGQFKPEIWTAFWLNAVELKDAKQVAREIGTSKSAVYVAKCRVLSRIRYEIDRFEQEFSHDED